MHERMQTHTRIFKKRLNYVFEKSKIYESYEILNFYKNVIDSIENTEFKPKWNENYPNLKFIKKINFI